MLTGVALVGAGLAIPALLQRGSQNGAQQRSGVAAESLPHTAE
ncbi:MAG: hypothetical protein WKF30_12870 [Pyrinomonadaceae bacterium]